VEALRPGLADTVDRRRQHVLTGVLLHVIEPTVPVDAAVHRSFRHRTVHDVKHGAVVAVDGIDDRGGPQPSGIEGLPAGRGVKGGAIQDHGLPSVHDQPFQDGRVELAEVRVGVVDTVRQQLTR
jgi:hypothetical protein